MMNPSSSKSVQQAEHATHHKNQKPEWLEAFLQKIFFGSCSIHQVRRNELNKYCINCDLSVCQYCISLGSHKHHKVLKIYRHIYKDVVSVAAMEKYIDCSKIQPYKSNKRFVIALNPLPHCGPTPDSKISCKVCKRRLAEPGSYHYCSIACKVTAFSRKSSDSVPPFLAILTPSDSVPPFLAIPTPAREKQKPAAEPEKPMHRRKGVPHRAPFF